jgi:hypothetical protein
VRGAPRRGARLLPLSLIGGCLLLGPADRRAHTDADGDGYSAAEDCDDHDPAVHPGAVEICDARDDDCDGAVDEDLLPDLDGDGFGDAAAGGGACFAGWVARGGDCDDTSALVAPGLPEVCDGLNTGCRADWTPADDAGLATWIGPDRAVEDLSAALAEAGAAPLALGPAGQLWICGRDTPWPRGLLAEGYEDLQIVGLSVEGPTGLLRPTLNTVAFDGAPVIRAVGRDGRLAIRSLRLVGGTGGARAGGAGLSVEGGGALRLQDLELVGNRATGTIDGGGGWISGLGYVRAERLLVQNNSLSGTQRGGGLAVIGGVLALSDATFVKNTASEHGGGLYLEGVQATLTDVHFDQNTAGHGGGGLEVGLGSRAECVGCTFTDNEAYSGGALRTAGEALLNCPPDVGPDDLVANRAAAHGAAWAVVEGGTLCLDGCTQADNRVLLDLGYDGEGYTDGRVGEDNYFRGRIWYRQTGDQLHCSAYQCQGEIDELLMDFELPGPHYETYCKADDYF